MPNIKVQTPDGTFNIQEGDLANWKSSWGDQLKVLGRVDVDENRNLIGLSPYTSPTAEPPLGQVLGLDPEAEKARQALLASYPQAPPVETDIYKSTLDKFQAQIDALNTLYAQKKADISAQYAKEGERQLGTQRALLAGAGMLGQVSGAAEKTMLKERQVEAEKGAVGLAEAELQSKIETIRSSAQTLAQSIYDKKLEDYRSGQKAILENIANRATVKSSAISKQVQDALAVNWDLSNADNAKTLSDSFKAGGLDVSPNEIIAEYKRQKVEYDKQQKEQKAKEEKEVAELAYKQAQTAKLEYDTAHPKIDTELDDRTGRLLLINKDTGATIKDLGAVIKKPTETEKLKEARITMNQAFNQLGIKGNDGYTSPETWKKFKQAWISEGLNSEDFIKQFYIYINPTHPQDYGQREANYIREVGDEEVGDEEGVIPNRWK